MRDAVRYVFLAAAQRMYYMQQLSNINITIASFRCWTPLSCMRADELLLGRVSWNGNVCSFCRKQTWLCSLAADLLPRGYRFSLFFVTDPRLSARQSLLIVRMPPKVEKPRRFVSMSGATTTVLIVHVF